MGDTIPAQKRAFVNAQVRILSAPLEPSSERWREQGGPAPEEGDLRERTVEDVLGKVNARLRSHNTAAFPPSALDHIAAQIDALYWANTEPDIHTGGFALGDGEINRDADLTTDENIALLPPTFTDPTASPARAATQTTSSSSRPSALEDFAEASRYAQLRDELRAAAARRDAARRKLAQLRRLEELVEPLGDPARSVQPHLPGRDGELERELERMKVLLARVGGALQ